MASSIVLVTILGGVPLHRVRAQDGAGAPQTSSTHLNLGVMRADGVLLPFASFDGDDWKASWPTDLFSQTLPATVSSIPRAWWGGAEPSEWRVFPPDGGPPQPFKVQAPTMIVAGRERRLALRTDRSAAPVTVPPFVLPYPKIGLAVAGDPDLKPIADISRTEAGAGRQFLATLGQAINSAEDRTVGGLLSYTSWRHPVNQKARARSEASLEAWYSTPLVEQGARVSYIEAVKRYPPGPEDKGCGLETFVTGWVNHSDKQEKPRARLTAAVVYCDREGASYMLPFGQITIRNRVYWVYQMSGRDHEWYAVAEATPSRVRVVAEYLAGSMPR